MKKIIAKFITENIDKLMHGEKINYRGNVYSAVPEMDDDGYCTDNAIIYRWTRDDLIAGINNGMEYGKIINGVAYKF